MYPWQHVVHLPHVDMFLNLHSHCLIVSILILQIYTYTFASLYFNDDDISDLFKIE